MGAKKQPLQIPITYEDVAVDFTQDEWKCLTEKQKAVYQNVLSETFKNLTFVDQNTMQNGKGRRRSGFHPPKTRGSKRKSQKPSSNLEDEERDDEKASPTCKGIFKGGPLYFCLTCGKCYKKYTNLFNHQFPSKAQQTTSHKALGSKPQNRRGRPFACELCDKNYRDASGLSRHRRTHLGYRPSSCSVCGKRFRDQSEVKRHMKVHQNRKPVAGNQECKVKAPRTSPRSQAPILRHMKVIQGPVARTKTRNSRASSLDVRSNPIPVRRTKRKIRCPYCFIRLTKKTCFLTHLKFHFKNQPNQCFSCKESSQSSVAAVGSHQNTHRKQNIYCCPICDICFRGKESLLDHLCYKKSGRPIKCWVILGHLLGFLYDPLRPGNTSRVEESSEEEE